jgi:hypothetical protein
MQISLSPSTYNKIIVVLVIAIAGSLGYNKIQNDDLAKTKTVYENPKTVEVVKIVREKGPVEIRTVVVEKPSGEKITTVNEQHGATLEQILSGAESQPVPVSVVMAPARTDRWLLGLSLLDFSPRESKNYTAWGGYSFRNRFDLLYGLNYRDGLHQNILGIIRF